MAKSYVLNSTSVNAGWRRSWSDSDWNDYSTVPSGATADYKKPIVGRMTGTFTDYRAVNILFDSSTLATLRTKTITSITLTLTVVSGTIPTTNNYQIGYKLNSSTSDYTRSDANSTAASTSVVAGYVKSSSAITASNTQISINMGTTVPKYGYTLGPYSESFRATITLATSATLTVVTNETDYTLTLSYNANGGTGAPSSQSSSGTTTGTPSATFTISSTKPSRSSASAGSYTVTWNANGGSVSTPSSTANRTTSYTFSKWNTAQGGGGTNYNPSGSITITANTTLYAQWSSSTSTASVTFPTPTRTGYTFNGWYTAASGGNYVGKTGNYTPTGTVTLYAQWSIIQYTIYYKKGDYGTGTDTSATKNYGTDITLKGAIFTRTGYTQTGWSTASNGSTKNYNLSATYSTNSGATLYPYWTINTYTVTYNANGGNASSVPSSQTKTYGQNLTLSSTKPTRSNASAGSYTVTYNANGGSVSPASASAARTTSYTFSTWNTASGGGGTSYAAGATYTTNAAVTLYAQWSSSTSTASLSLPTVSRAGYNFDGWYTAASGGSLVWKTGSYTPSADITLYAHWTAAVGTPTFTTQPTSQNVYRGASASLTVAATVSVGTITYQWQYSSNNSTWTDISGYTSTSLPLTTSSVGTSYRRCIATATKDGVSKTSTSNTASVAVAATPTPSINTQPAAKSVYVGGTASLSIAATVASGTLSYQWQSSNDNSTWSNISGATSTSYSAPTSAAGTKYYRCIVTNTLYGYTTTATSSSVSVTVSVAAPTITTQPSGGTVFVGGSKNVSVTATAPYGTLSYQWQSSTNNSTWSNVSGANSASYSVPTGTAKTIYYRCVVTTTYSGQSPSTTSNSVSVIIVDVTTPTFTKNPQSANYAYGVTANALTVTATSNGTLSYQWQSSTNNSTWTNISGATSTSYTPPTTPAGVIYYRCVATSVGGSQTKTANSTSAAITVVEASAPVFTYDLSTVDVEYNAADVAETLNGKATATNGSIVYQWYKSTDGGSNWFPISGAESETYQPPTSVGGTAYYRVVATNVVGTSSVSATSGEAKVTVKNVILDYDAKWSQYINNIGKPFVKLARLDFLNPNGSVLYTLDNNPLNQKSGAFIQAGELTVNLQNGPRRSATVTISNIDGEFDYNVNKLWFGQQVRLWEGMILPGGQEFYISQGVFYVKDPDETFEPGLKETTLNLVDKWAYLDGSLFGNLEGTYEVPVNSNIFNVIASVLNFDRGNGYKVDESVPIFTNYYNGKTTTLPDGSTVPLTNTPYTYRCDSENGTYADIILEMNTMLAGWIGYDANGQLRLDPSQDDILDTNKPIQWQFTMRNSTFLGATYSVKNSEVYNDIIIVGESLSEYGQTAGRATNYDPRSDTNVNIIGLKTKRYQQSGYYTQDICESLAVFKLKRESVLKKSVSIKSAQMFHLQENNLVTIERSDKLGNPIERHLITGYTRPIAQSGEMTINATSVLDSPMATITRVQ